MNLILKRSIDIFFSLILLFLILPFWVLIVIAIKLESKGPIFYRHTRVGKNKKTFTCLKFRSMQVNSDPDRLVSSPDDDRVTRVGYFLRKTSLDETPQLLNVLFGDMSIVGPRPALPSQVEQFSTKDFDKLLVKPGLTGWTQINGRNSINYGKRMELDCWYAKNWSIFLDIKILFLTPLAILNTKNIYDVK